MKVLGILIGFAVASSSCLKKASRGPAQLEQSETKSSQLESLRYEESKEQTLTKAGSVKSFLSETEINQGKIKHDVAEPNGEGPALNNYFILNHENKRTPLERLSKDVIRKIHQSNGGETFQVIKGAGEDDLDKVKSGDSSLVKSMSQGGSMAIYTLDFAGMPSAPVTNDFLAERLQIAKDYYDQASFGEVQFEIKDAEGNYNVLPTVEITPSLPISCSLGGGQYYDWHYAAKDVLSAQGIDLNQYKYVLIFLPNAGYLGCNFAGVANVNCGDECLSFYVRNSIPWQTSRLIQHEVGHNLGMRHAGAISSSQYALPQDNYNDQTDPMGRGNNVGLNAPHMDQQGWYSGNKVVTVTEDGEYWLSPLNQPADSSPHPVMLKVQLSGPYSFYGENGYHIYISNRIAIFPDLGLDQGNGFISGDADQIHLHTGNPISSGPTGLFEQLENPGDIIELSEMQVRIEYLEKQGSNKKVKVRFGALSCSAVPPTVKFSPLVGTYPGSYLSPVDYLVSITNNDQGLECPATTFQVAFSSDDPLVADSANNLSVELAPGETQSINLQVFLEQNAPVVTNVDSIDYTFNISVQDNDNLSPNHNPVNQIALYRILNTTNPDTTAPLAPSDLKLFCRINSGKPYVIGKFAAGIDDDDMPNPDPIPSYRIYRNGSLHLETFGTEFLDFEVADGQTYQFEVRSLDNGNNESLLAATATLKVKEAKCNFHVNVHSFGGIHQESGDYVRQYATVTEDQDVSL